MEMIYECPHHAVFNREEKFLNIDHFVDLKSFKFCVEEVRKGVKHYKEVVPFSLKRVCDEENLDYEFQLHKARYLKNPKFSLDEPSMLLSDVKEPTQLWILIKVGDVIEISGEQYRYDGLDNFGRTNISEVL